MKLNDGYTPKPDYLLQNSTKVENYENCKESLELDLIPVGLNIKRLPAINTPLKIGKFSDD